MTDVTVSMDQGLVVKARIAAERDGKTLSAFIAETVEQRIGPPITQLEALQSFLAGPPMDLLDENGRAPTRDELIGRPRFR